MCLTALQYSSQNCSGHTEDIIMELKRKCAGTILNWLKKSDKALLVKGARQVGKTHLIRSVLNETDTD